MSDQHATRWNLPPVKSGPGEYQLSDGAITDQEAIQQTTNWRRLKRDYRKRCLARGCNRRDAHRFSTWALALEYSA